MELDPAQLAIADRYKILIGSIVPRPIAFVSTISTDGRTNLAPFSFFNALSSNPMMLMFCISNRPDGSAKDTLRNCDLPENSGTGEFVVNIAAEVYARRVAAAAEQLPYGESEFGLVGLTPAACAKVRAPRIAESPVSFECRTRQIVRLNPGAVGGGNVVFGEVVHIHLVDGLVNERFHVDPDRLGAIGRMGGLAYCRTRDRFELPMGRLALEAEI